MQVVKPSVSRATLPHGTAFTVFVEPSGSTMTRPVPVSITGNGPVEYGVAGPGGVGSLARGTGAAGAGCVVDEGSEIGGGPASGGG
jgi:hypothetical protein